MLTTPAIAAAVNFTFNPVPDYADYGKEPSACTMFQTPACCLSNIIEACVLHATGCEGGCSGPDASQLANFLGCFVKGEQPGVNETSTSATNATVHATVQEGVCKPKSMAKCLNSSRIAAAAAANACVKSKHIYEPIMARLTAASTKIQTFPHALVNGKLLKQDTEKNDEKHMKQSLCKAGVKAAC